MSLNLIYWYQFTITLFRLYTYTTKRPDYYRSGHRLMSKYFQIFTHSIHVTQIGSLGETFALHRPSVCRISMSSLCVCVTFVCPARMVKIFWQYFCTDYSSGTWLFSNNISLYFENGRRYDHSYNGRRIGTRMRSIEWCHYQWSSMIP